MRSIGNSEIINNGEKMNETEKRVILDVPFREKNEAKELGAWWDPDIKKWFVPEGKDSEPFSKWYTEENLSTN